MGRFRTAVILVVTVLNLASVIYSCPMAACDCTTNINGEPVIYCKFKGLTQIPAVVTSTEIYAQLTLSKNSITEIPAQAFQGLNVKSIEILDNPIATISNDAFSGIESTLEGLSLHGDSRLNAPWTAISNLTRLKHLEFNNFSIGSLEDETVLAPFVNLEELAMTYCQLNYVKPAVFLPVDRTLTELDLSSNRFVSLPVGVIRGLPSLSILRLTSNNIRTIGYNAFETNSRLSELDLSQNIISRLEPGCFNYVTSSLLYLGLHLNRITGNELHALKELTAIQQINLGYNSLGSIPNGTFSNMAALEFLNLQSTQLHTLTPATFQGLGSSLLDLTLTENRITRIERGTFSSMSGMRELSLDDQKVDTFAQTLVPGVFQGLANIKTLNLHKTQTFGSVDNWQAVKELRGLKSLDLSESGISQVPDFTFADMTMMEKLSLSKNKLKNITQETFVGLRDSLTSLELQGNNLTTFDHCTFANFSRLYPEAVKLGDNKLECDCGLQWLSEWVQQRLNESSPSNQYFIRLQILWTCSDGRSFKDIRPEDLGCPENTTRRDCTDYYTTTTTTTTTQPPQTTIKSTPDPTTVTTVKTSTTTQPTVVLTLFNITSVTTTGFDLKWGISHPNEVDYFMVFYTDLSTSERENSRRISSAAITFNIERLKPGRLYEVCLTVFYKTLSIRSNGNCTTRETAALPTTAPTVQEGLSGEEIGIIAGSIVGGVLLLVIIIIIIFILVRHRQQEHVYAKPREPSPWNRTGKPHEAYDSKRFTKQKKLGTEHHIKEIRHVQGDTNLQRASAGSYQYLDRKVDSGTPNGIQSNGFQHRPNSQPNKPNSNTTKDSKYYEIALDGIESHI